jgi:hypothetical protein
MGTGSFPEVKNGQGVTLTPHLMMAAIEGISLIISDCNMMMAAIESRNM